jgi:hypothetical protein
MANPPEPSTSNGSNNGNNNMTNNNNTSSSSSLLYFETAEAQMVEIRKALIAAQEAEDQQLCQRWKESRNDTTTTTITSDDDEDDDDVDGGDDDGDEEDEGVAAGGTTTIGGITQNQEEPGKMMKKKRKKKKNIVLDERTVLYHPHGGTLLFKSIEEQNWEKAEQILRQHPDQASIWVVSTGTVQTTFDWSLWKRLPLHEAVRRQPPASFILNLLRVFPTAIRERTQFGELSLHLAVECGASVPVIQLLCLYDWELCCTAVDQSGRTVLEILKNSDGSVLDPDDQAAIIDTITATVRTFDQIQSHHRLELRQVRQRHQIELEQLRYVYTTNNNGIQNT